MNRTLQFSGAADGSWIPPYPEDCSLAVGSGFLHLVYEAVQDAPLGVEKGKNRTSSNVLLTLITYCYARGIYSSEQIESTANSDPNIRYICVGNFPESDQIRAFRRNNRIAVEQALANLLERIYGSAQGLYGQAIIEATRRVRRAIQQDSIELDV